MEYFIESLRKLTNSLTFHFSCYFAECLKILLLMIDNFSFPFVDCDRLCKTVLRNTNISHYWKLTDFLRFLFFAGYTYIWQWIVIRTTWGARHTLIRLFVVVSKFSAALCANVNCHPTDRHAWTNVLSFVLDKMNVNQIHRLRLNLN